MMVPVVKVLAVVAALLLTLLVPAAALFYTLRARRAFGTSVEQATYEVLRTANEAAPPLRAGLTRAEAQKSLRGLRALLDARAVALTDETHLLGWEGAGEHHGEAAAALAAPVVATGRPRVTTPSETRCHVSGCPIQAAVIVPIVVGDAVVGTLGAYGTDPPPGLIRTAGEVARWVATQVELAELDQSRTRLAEAELRALRAQISPHFIYNALTAIAAYVHTDPTRARDLLLEFADFTRYSFRRHGQFTTLAEELKSIDKYLVLERARFGERLQVTLQIAPEVLPVAVPVFVLQPLVENAVRHGLEAKTGPGHISIVAEDSGPVCRISVEDDGV
ncbi:MAG: sensor histidine kinase, partial [Acidimicrobiia bacterium]